jgi:hypothetical protein
MLAVSRSTVSPAVTISGAQRWLLEAWDSARLATIAQKLKNRIGTFMWSLVVLVCKVPSA